jgi:hypothetical protein
LIKNTLNSFARVAISRKKCFNKWDFPVHKQFGQGASLRAAVGWQPMRPAGSGMPVLPVLGHWFVIWIIPLTSVIPDFFNSRFGIKTGNHLHRFFT